MKGYIHSLESFGSVDGPGIRFIVFFQGCPMRCIYCHNVDTRIENKGELKEAEDLIHEALKYKEFWGETGGITVSGGEPLLQLDFLIELFKLGKKNNIHMTLDTSGILFNEKNYEKIDELLKYVDLVLLDIKQINNLKHIKLTKFTNENVINFAKYLSKKRIPVWIRYVLVPGFTDDEKDMRELRNFIDTLDNVEKVEVLPYHSLGEFKWEKMNLKYELKGIEPPTMDKLNKAKEILEKKH